MPRDDRDLPEGEPDPRLNPMDDTGFDSTGLDGVIDMSRGAFQIMTAAKLSGFTDAQAFQMARDFFTLMIRMSVERQGEGGK